MWFGFTRRVAWLVPCAWLLLSPQAFAQAPPDDDPQEQAVELFRQSREAFDRGDYREAARLSLQAHELSPNGDLYYNYARALDSAKDWDQATTAYRELIARYPEHGKVRFAEQRIEEIAALQQKPTPTPPPPPPEPPKEEPDPVSPWPWVLAGVGVVALGAGFAVGGVAAARHDDAVEEPEGLAADELQREAENLETAALVTIGVGGVIALAGLIGVVDVTSSGDVALDMTHLRLRF